MELYELTAAEAASQIGAGTLDALEYARALLARHEAVESRLSALEYFDPETFLEDAARSDEAIRRARKGGSPPFPLAGIPIGVKDNIDTAGVPTRSGSALRADYVPSRNAACLDLLWKSGAHLFGKTVTTELAFLDPGPTRNPWNLAHTPGGSSSGSVAGVAAGLFPVALGTQTAGSVIRPAAYCGIVGFVPTYGRLPMEGVLPFAPTVDQLGIFTRTVSDAALAYASMMEAGAATAPDSGGGASEERAYPVAPLDRAPFLGIAREYFVSTAEDEMGRMTIHAARHLAVGGAIIHVVHLPDGFNEVHKNHRLIMEVEMARGQEESFRTHRSAYGKNVADLIEAGLRAREEDYLRALAGRKRFQASASRLVGELDALILPAAPFAAPYGLESTGDPRFNTPWTHVGFPVITIPVAQNTAGLPLGIQLVGAPGTDIRLLRIASYVEEQLGWGRRIAPLRG